MKKEKPVLAVLGGIGSGKTTVSNLLLGEKGWLFSADQEAHLLLETPDVVEKLISFFGKDILSGDGLINRKVLGERVFPDKVGLDYLESILHPLIRKKALEFIEKGQNTHDCTHLLLDIPLLLEKNWRNLCTILVFVKCGDEKRLQRVRGRNWNEGELEIRENAQFPLTTKESISDYIIDNSAELDQTRQQAADLLKLILP
ncbi:MAG: dephospho-CoA kinase [Gemmataceae bacterium]|nr:dephospho-CoA kinase [Gemmataceae bacterium]